MKNRSRKDLFVIIASTVSSVLTAVFAFRMGYVCEYPDMLLVYLLSFPVWVRTNVGIVVY